MKQLKIILILFVTVSCSFSHYINDTLNVKIEFANSKIPDSSKQEQNIPNPFPWITDFKFSISEKAYYDFSILDSNGITIAFFFNKKLDTGKYIMSFDSYKFKTGRYFYRLSSNGFTETKNLLFVK